MATGKTIRHSPRYIIFWAVSNYLSESEMEALIHDFIKGPVHHCPRFLPTIAKHFDIERFRTHPVIWQDIWLYNYIMYDVKGRFPRNRLIAEYDKRILIPSIKVTNAMKSILDQL
jgi:hypothetical protein